MKICVTGGCGYIGSLLVPKLLADGHTVTVVDTQWFGSGGLPKDNGHLTVRREDVRELLGWDQDVVIHLASISQNEMYAKNKSLAESVNRWLPIAKRLIYASSVAAYGTSDDVLTEDSPLKPTTPYGVDKAWCEERVLVAGGVVVRSASVCGDASNMRFDTPINRMTRNAIKGFITVNGGRQKRCHVSIDDLCDFYRLLVTSDVKGVFNVVHSTQTMTETAKMVQRITGGEIQTNPSSDERSYQVSGEKAFRVLGWKPKWSLEEAVLYMKAASGAPRYSDFSPARMRML